MLGDGRRGRIPGAHRGRCGLESRDRTAEVWSRHVVRSVLHLPATPDGPARDGSALVPPHSDIFKGVVDPYLSLLVGALGAALIGLLGAWIQAKREHSRWVRERRFDAYVGFLNITETSGAWNNRPSTGDQFEVIDGFSDALNTLRIVGPDNVFSAGWDYWQAVQEYSVAEWPKKTRKSAGLAPVPERSAEESLAALLEQRQSFVDEAQRAVRISYRR